MWACFQYNSVCDSETWCSNTELPNNSNLSLTGFDSVLYERSKNRRWSWDLIFFNKESFLQNSKDLLGSDEDKEIFSPEILNKNSSDMVQLL